MYMAEIARKAQVKQILLTSAQFHHWAMTTTDRKNIFKKGIIIEYAGVQATLQDYIIRTCINISFRHEIWKQGKINPI